MRSLLTVQKAVALAMSFRQIFLERKCYRHGMQYVLCVPVKYGEFMPLECRAGTSRIQYRKWTR